MSQHWVRTGNGSATVKVQTTTLELCITNCGPHARKNVLEKQLVDGGVMNISYVDKPKNSVTAFVGFPSVTDRDAGLRAIACLTSKQDKKYSVKLSTRRVPEHILNGTQDPAVKASDAKSRPPVVSKPGSANESTAPWLAVPYADQLRKKQAEIDASLRSVCTGLMKHCTRAGAEGRSEAGVGMKRPRPADDEEAEEEHHNLQEEHQGDENEADKQDEGEGRDVVTAAQGTSSWAQDMRLPSWLRQLMQTHAASPSAASSASSSSSAAAAAAANMPLPCPLHPIIPSPVLTGYRNKAMFTCGRDGEGVPTVGFRLGSYGHSNAVAFPPPDQPLLPQQMLEVAGAVQQWMRGSPLPPYDIESHEGVWRGVTLRWAAGGIGGVGEMMVTLTSAPPYAKNEGAQLDTAAVGDVAAARATYTAELQRLQALLSTDTSPHTATSSSSSSSPQWRVTSLHIQEYNGRSIPDVNQHPFKLLWSSQGAESGGTLTETVCGMKFQISPSAFFQVNTRAAEVLYSTARLLALEGQQGMQQAMTLLGGRDGGGVCTFESLLSHRPPQRLSTALVDVCCGTGTIGLCMAPYVGRVVGVEVSADAVSDAVRNATLNAASNAVFVAQRAESAMRDILAIAEKGSSSSGMAAGSAATASSTTAAPGSCAPSIAHVVAIVDPPRGGLHPSVILALRTCKALKRLVYVSCNPGLGGSFVEDAVKLMAPQEGSRKSAYARGPAFHLACAVPVDLFPHTPHTELVALFERD